MQGTYMESIHIMAQEDSLNLYCSPLLLHCVHVHRPRSQAWSKIIHQLNSCHCLVWHQY